MNVKRLIVLNNHISEGRIVVPPFMGYYIKLTDIIIPDYIHEDILRVYISGVTVYNMPGEMYNYIRKYIIRIIKIYGIKVGGVYIYNKI